MKKLHSTLCGLLITTGIFAQSNISVPMDFHIEKEVLPPRLQIDNNTVRWIDPNNNNVIDGGETFKICFEVENRGRGDAYGCVVQVTATGDKEGLIIRDVNLPVIAAGSRQKVEVPIIGTDKTLTGEVGLTIKINEPNGFGDDIRLPKIGTHRLRTPMIEVAEYLVSGGKDGKLNPKEPFTVKVIVQNTDQGIAENVTVELSTPVNISQLGGDNAHMTIGTMQPNETRILEYELIPNQYASGEIDLRLNLAERTGKYAKSADIPLQIGQYVGNTVSMNVQRKDGEVTIMKASLLSDIDKNIPVANVKNLNTFVLIIANEHYQQVASVPFALNDGNIFREYCIKTLGISDKHIKYLSDATGNQLKAGINWLANLTEAFENPKIIIYYAGHGIPDESSRTAYLLPVDGIISDMSTCYKLDDLYTVIGSMPASQITIFMDACFSGSKREDGMLASARGVALKAKSGVPQGNMVVFSAAQGDETAFPYREQQHGMFTYHLLKKLQETNGDVTLQDLGNYIIREVKKRSLEENDKKQTPCVTPSAAVGTEWQIWKLK